MKKKTSPNGLQELLWREIEASSNCALILDYDGTLSPFTSQRDRALPYPGVKEILAELLKVGMCRVALVTGRTIEDLVHLLDIRPLPEIWGSHGMERLTRDGRYRSHRIEEDLQRALEEAQRWAEEADLQELCERKHGSIAFHLRGLPPRHARMLKERVSEAWSLIARGKGLSLKQFDGGVELRAPGPNKGDAVKEIIKELRDNDPIAYLGDDVTDEDAFAAVDGRGLGVLVRSTWRPTKAKLWLRPPEELLRFLRRWYEACLKARGL